MILCNLKMCSSSSNGLKIIIILLSIALITISCSDSDDNNVIVPLDITDITGTWDGYHTDAGESEERGPDEIKFTQTNSTISGTMTSENETMSITGSINGNQVSITFAYSNGTVVTNTGTVVGDTSISGTWTNSNGGSGTWRAVKINIIDITGIWTMTSSYINSCTGSDTDTGTVTISQSGNVVTIQNPGPDDIVLVRNGNKLEKDVESPEDNTYDKWNLTIKNSSSITGLWESAYLEGSTQLCTEETDITISR